MPNEYALPATTNIATAANRFVGPAVPELKTAYEGTFNVVVSSDIVTSPQAVDYHEIFHYHLNNADSQTLCSAFHLSGMLTNPVGDSQPNTATASLVTSEASSILSNILEGATNSAGLIAANVAGARGWVSDELNKWIADYTQASFQASYVSLANTDTAHAVDNSDVTITMDASSGVVKITDLSGSVANIADCFDDDLCKQFDEAHLDAYKTAGSNAGPTQLPGLRGDVLVFALQSKPAHVDMAGEETQASKDSNSNTMTFSDLDVTERIPKPVLAFSITLGCTASGAGLPGSAAPTGSQVGTKFV